VVDWGVRSRTRQDIEWLYHMSHSIYFLIRTTQYRPFRP